MPLLYLLPVVLFLLVRPRPGHRWPGLFGRPTRDGRPAELSRGDGEVDQSAALKDEAADLRRRFARVEAESAAHRRALVGVRVAGLRAHRVPLRRIDRAPGPELGRLHFADGTTLLARSATKGDIGVLAMALEGGDPVTVRGYADHADGVRVVLSAASRRGPATVLAVALDQSD